MKKWTSREEEFLKNSNKKKTLSQVSKLLNRSKSSVKHKASRLGVTFAKEKAMWKTSEEQYLIENYYIMSYSDLSKALGKSVEAVKHKSYMLHLQDKKETESRKWTEWEVQYLEKTYHKRGVDYIAKRLDRSMYSVKRKASALGISAYNSEFISFRVLSKCFNSNMSVIHRWKDKFGMPYTAVKRGKVIQYLVDIEKFWVWVEGHKNIIPWNKYEILSLVPEPPFVKGEIEKSKSFGVNHRKKVPNIVKSSIIRDYSKGKSVKDIARDYGRTVYSVEHILKNIT